MTAPDPLAPAMLAALPYIRSEVSRHFRMFNACPDITKDDVAGDVGLVIWRRRVKFDATKSAFSSWATRQVKNAMLDLLRHRNRRIQPKSGVIDLETREAMPELASVCQSLPEIFQFTLIEIVGETWEVTECLN